MHNKKIYKNNTDIDILENQYSNTRWWTENPMSYDWRSELKIDKFTEEWYNEIDRKFIFGARMFAHDEKPFDRLIPYEEISGKRVLEIGCGMGLHSELLVRAGATLTSIDISETSIMATRKRFELRGLEADIKQMDAEKLQFPDESFDFVWSWGVIHHSSATAAIIKEISRVLCQNGDVRLMVYNLNSMAVYVQVIKEFLLGYWRGRTLEEILWKNTDGFMSRYYTADILSDIMSLFFRQVDARTFGQDADAVPLPRFLRKPVLSIMNDRKVRYLANKRGAFLFMSAKK